MKYFAIFLVLIGFIGTAFAEPFDSTVAEIRWAEASFPSHDGTKATVIVTDHDMNKHPNVIDYVWIEVHSDSDRNGFKLTLFETDFDSGIFEGDVVFVENPPSDSGFIHTVEGDTITAKYVDTNFPPDYVSDLGNIVVSKDKIEMSSTAIVGGSSPPLERAPASNFNVLDITGVPVKDNSVSVDQQVKLDSHLENQMDQSQPFAYLVQIKNEQGKVESLSWITGNLTAHQTLNSGVTWIPLSQGVYSATAFVWESIDNPTALSPPLSMEIRVE